MLLLLVDHPQDYLKQNKVKVKSAYRAKWLIRPATTSGFSGTEQLGVFLHPLGWVLVHHWVTPSIKFGSTHLYTWMERGSMKVNFLPQEHSAMTLARAIWWILR